MLRFAILGAGNIAHAMAKSAGFLRDKINPYLVASRDLSKAQSIASEFGFEHACGSYEELYCNPDVDVVYIATPHSHHFEQSKRCLEAGKHVLCEKSFCANAKQSQELFDLARRKNLFIGEAVWTRFLPVISKAKELISSGVIGNVKSVYASFGEDLRWASRLVDPALAGGALLDLGIYNLTFADIFAPGKINKIASCVIKSDAGVDAAHSIEIEYDSGIIATLASSMVSALPNRGIIYGDKGRLELPCFWGGQSIELYQSDQKAQTYPCPFDCNGYEYEVRAMIEAIQENKYEFAAFPHHKTIQIMTLMDKLRDEWGVVFPFEVGK